MKNDRCKITLTHKHLNDILKAIDIAINATEDEEYCKSLQSLKKYLSKALDLKPDGELSFIPIFENMDIAKSIDPDIQDVINKYFWEML